MAGVLLGLTGLASLALGAHALRRRFLAELHGPPARLVDLVGVLSMLVVVSELLGAVRLLRFFAVAPALIVCGALAYWFGSRRAAAATAVPTAGRVGPTTLTDVADPPRRGGPVVTAMAVVAVGVLTADWASRIVHVYSTGPMTIDTTWYHLPIAARFAQTGSLIDLHFVDGGPSLATFYPHTSELLHALGVVFLTHDTLSPLLNLFWVAVALFGAWCIGRAFGAAPLVLVAVATVLAGPQLVMYEAGEGLNDLLGVAMTLAAVAVLVNTWSPALRVPGAFCAGLAMGLALGSKFTVAGTAGLLTICVIVFCQRELRVRVGALWFSGLTLTGAFWYVRNLLAVHNPVPPADVSLGPIHLPHLTIPVSTVWHHFFESHSLSQTFFPGFRYALGPLWWAVLVIAFCGFVFGIATKVDQRVRMIAITGLGGVVIYVFAPQVLGFGDTGVLAGVFFRYNVRYLAIPLVLGAVAFAATCAQRGSRPTAAAALVFGVVLVGSQLDSKLWPFDGALPPEGGLPHLSRRELALGIAAGVAIALFVVALVVFRPRATLVKPGHAATWTVAAGLVIVAASLFGLQHLYLERRYADVPDLPKTYAWARHLRNQRIGLSGTILQYPLTGNDISNREYIVENRKSALDTNPINNCQTWRDQLNRKHLDYVVITTFDLPTAREQGWTASDPAARLVLTEHNGRATAWVYALSRRLDPTACPRTPS